MSWRRLLFLVATLPVLIAAAAWAERESRAREARRRLARLGDRELYG